MLDSNFIIRAFHKNNPEHIFLKKIIGKNQIFIPTIVVAEVLTKVNHEEKRSLNALLEFSQLVDLDFMLAEKAAQIRYQTLKKKKVFLLDCIVAATVFKTKSVLLTNNTKDYLALSIKLKSF
ncbi:PIN domain-containing protein [Patescibacteria group bacterium]|nr:PIN domain-containing protein [Patescibacteria group bacterium]